jgi:hypothetical protein
MSIKGDVNRKWTSTEEYRKNHDRIFKADVWVAELLATIDWTNPAQKISKYFTVREATYLPSWGKYHMPGPLEQSNIVILASKMDKVRELFDQPIEVHCWLRPVDYNKYVGGAKKSMHISGGAVDFHVKGVTCSHVRDKLDQAFLDSVGLRREDNPQGNWVHIDLKEVPPGGSRIFKP